MRKIGTLIGGLIIAGLTALWVNAQQITVIPPPLTVANITGLGTGIATALGINVGSAGSVVVNGGALGTPSSGTLTNATIPVSGLTGTTMSTTTKTATCSAGTITSGATITERFFTLGKMIFAEFVVTPVYTVCTGYLIFPLPTGTAAANYILIGGDGSAGYALQAFISSGATSMNLLKYDGTFPSSGTGSTLTVSGWYEIQ